MIFTIIIEFTHDQANMYVLAYRMNALFWTEYFDSSYSIWRANLDGSNAEPILTGIGGVGTCMC